VYQERLAGKVFIDLVVETLDALQEPQHFDAGYICSVESNRPALDISQTSLKFLPIRMGARGSLL